MEVISMNKNYIFLIESEQSRHKLFLNGKKIAKFATLGAAEEEANQLANRAVPGATLSFGLDFKWTLTGLEIRVALLEPEAGESTLRDDEVDDKAGLAGSKPVLQSLGRNEMNIAQYVIALILSVVLIGAAPTEVFRAQDAPPATAATMQTAEQLQQLVAPIALYPDSLVAQILA